MSGDKKDSLPWAILSGLAARCPRCQRGSTFAGFLNVAPACKACGLNFGFADAGDGPAVFVMLFGGFLIVGAALWIEVMFEPPIWVYVVVFLPLTAIVCIGMLRPLKGLLIALQYRNKAGQGRLES
ncbi:MAG: DUF983 domain-containing protein [Xanthobacteraceae bacterium]